MCGIVAYIGNQNATSLAADGLKRLEYRGYDSWGIAWIKDSQICLKRAVGKICEEANLPSEESHLAIAHTRWATHGAIDERNAHPHLSNSKELAVVHNGIIENSAELKAFLSRHGFTFSSGTDTEVIPNLVEFYLSKEKTLEKAFPLALARLEGSYAIALLSAPDHGLFFARRSSPLCIGLAEEGTYLASDTSAFIGKTKKVIYLDDAEYGYITEEGVKIRNLETGNTISKKPASLGYGEELMSKGNFPHYMLKEIFEQPRVIEETLSGRIKEGKLALPELKLTSSYLKSLKKIFIIGCGTAHYAGLTSKYLFEQLAGVEVEADFSGEFKYRLSKIDPSALYLLISQSGETAETIDALRKAKAAGATTLTIVNVQGSTLARESANVLYTKAGPEIGVASTKAFTSQLLTLTLFAFYLGQLRNKKSLEPGQLDRLISELQTLKKKADATIISNLNIIKGCAHFLAGFKSVLLIGRNINYPIALEGALKLKETSYIHAEGMPAGELKHGPLALIDENFPVICIAPSSSTYAKTLNSIEEIKARKGRVVAIATAGDKEIGKLADYLFYLPKVDELLSPFLSVMLLQLLAYYTALERGCDIDRPRNLAKSVTVE